MGNFIYVSIMAVLQGLTEFLPVSSSGHLAVLGKLFHFSEDRCLALGILLHAGSLLAILFFYRKELLKFFSFSKERMRLAGLLILGSIPAGVAGILLKKTGFAEELFGSLSSIGLCFLITATVLRMTGKPGLIVREKTDAADAAAHDLEHLSIRQAIVIGLAQMIAILPGISRSGSTIAAGILTNVERESAAAFSFLLGLIAIAGATLLEALSLFRSQTVLFQDGFQWYHLVWGLLLSAAVSIFSLSFLVRLIKSGKFSRFSWYLYGLGAAVLIWQLFN